MASQKTILNFGKNVRIEPEHYFQPVDAAEVLAILKKHPGKTVRVIGARHAWSEGGFTRDVLLDLSKLDFITVDAGQKTVTVGAGCKIKHLVGELGKHGLTLPSLGLIDEQTVAGATATSTHGSGKNSLSHYVEAAEIAHFDLESGEPKITRVQSGSELRAARCSLGLMGVVVSLTLRCREAYNIEEYADSHKTLDSVLACESEYPQQQFYLMPWSWSFFGHHRRESTSPRSWLAGLYRLYCFLAIDVGLHLPILFVSRLWKTSWGTRFFYRRLLPLAIVRKWRVVDDSAAMLTMQHELFRHIEIEVFVQRDKLKSAIDFLRGVLEHSAGEDLSKANRSEGIERFFQDDAFRSLKGRYIHHYPICIRRIPCDDVLVSMASPSKESTEDWYAISLISYHWPRDREGFFLFAEFVGAAFAELFGGRCHWGKYNPLSFETNEQLYPDLDEFRAVVDQFDEGGRFRNEWLQRVVYGEKTGK